MARPSKTLAEIVEDHLPDDVCEPLKPEYQWQSKYLALAVKEFSRNVRAFRETVDRVDRDVYEKTVKDHQARKLKKAERSADSSE